MLFFNFSDNRNRRLFFLLLISLSVLVISCSKSSSTGGTTTPATPSQPLIPAPSPEIIQTLTITNPTTGSPLKSILFIPSSSTTVPAVVVMHGSGGLWSSTDDTKLASQFNGWIDSFRVHNIAALFIDSYTPRGVKTFHDVAPPENIFLAAEFVRPRDAYEGLTYLRSNARIKSDKIALLGFSHGGTTVLSTMVDAAAVTKSTAWSLISNNITYTTGVLAPAAKPTAGGFVAAVSYYPGAAMFSYYGRPGTPSNGKYQNYAPILLHAAGNDPLYTTTYTNSDNNSQVSAYDGLIQKAQLNVGSSPITKQVYTGAAHSFDGETSVGVDADASKLARTRSIAFLKQYLFN